MKQISNQIFLTLLNNEIAILKMLKNPNLLSLCDVYTTAHNIYIITEYCDQGDLNNYIKSKGRLNEDEALKILKHLLLGLLEI
jgi:serine/threonine protein kinase